METTADKRTKEYKATIATQATSKWRAVRYVQIHAAFAPLQGKSTFSWATFGNDPMTIIEERPNGIYGEMKDGRQFLIPYGNISFVEYELEA